MFFSLVSAYIVHMSLSSTVFAVTVYNDSCKLLNVVWSFCWAESKSHPNKFEVRFNSQQTFKIVPYLTWNVSLWNYLKTDHNLTWPQFDIIRSLSLNIKLIGDKQHLHDFPPLQNILWPKGKMRGKVHSFVWHILFLLKDILYLSMLDTLHRICSRSPGHLPRS